MVVRQTQFAAYVEQLQKQTMHMVQDCNWTHWPVTIVFSSFPFVAVAVLRPAQGPEREH